MVGSFTSTWRRLAKASDMATPVAIWREEGKKEKVGETDRGFGDGGWVYMMYGWYVSSVHRISTTTKKANNKDLFFFFFSFFSLFFSSSSKF